MKKFIRKKIPFLKNYTIGWDIKNKALLQIIKKRKRKERDKHVIINLFLISYRATIHSLNHPEIYSIYINIGIKQGWGISIT